MLCINPPPEYFVLRNCSPSRIMLKKPIRVPVLENKMHKCLEVNTLISTVHFVASNVWRGHFCEGSETLLLVCFWVIYLCAFCLRFVCSSVQVCECPFPVQWHTKYCVRLVCKKQHPLNSYFGEKEVIWLDEQHVSSPVPSLSNTAVSSGEKAQINRFPQWYGSVYLRFWLRFSQCKTRFCMNTWTQNIQNMVPTCLKM